MRSVPINLLERLDAMDCAHHLTTVRKQRGLTLEALVDVADIHVTPIARDAAAADQPELALRRTPAIGPAAERARIRALVEGPLVRHQTRRCTAR